MSDYFDSRLQNFWNDVCSLWGRLKLKSTRRIMRLEVEYAVISLSRNLSVMTTGWQGMRCSCLQPEFSGLLNTKKLLLWKSNHNQRTKRGSYRTYVLLRVDPLTGDWSETSRLICCCCWTDIVRHFTLRNHKFVKVIPKRRKTIFEVTHFTFLLLVRRD